MVEIGVVDGKLRDGSDNGGIVGTESGGKPKHLIFKSREKGKKYKNQGLYVPGDV